MIATETFYAGEEDGIVKAGEIVADHHPLVRKYPDRFRPDRPRSTQPQRDGDFDVTLAVRAPSK
jgi:hypothetical protein